jgi:hypothetical protein
MAEFDVRLVSQEGLDAAGRLQSHQWAEVPSDLTGPFMTGGLKKIRRFHEAYFSFRFTPDGAARVRGVWRAGEPTLLLRFHRIPFMHGRPLVRLGRLRSTGTLDIYRGYHEIRGGDSVSPAAVLERRPWPEDMPWVAPSAGEFTESEKQKLSYLGIFEIRVERTPQGCKLHTVLVDFPPAQQGVRAAFVDKPWSPMRSLANLEFLRVQVRQVARELGHEVRFTTNELEGTPARLRFRFDRHAAAT